MGGKGEGVYGARTARVSYRDGGVFSKGEADILLRALVFS